MTTNKEQLKQDVIDAARAWDASCGRKGALHDSTLRLATELRRKVQALDAPTPVKPEEVEPGKTFRFLLDDGELSGLCRARKMEGSGWPIYEHLEQGPKHMVYRFERGDKIIPIPEGEEE